MEKEELMNMIKLLTEKVEKLSATPHGKSRPFQDKTAPVKMEQYSFEKILNRKDTNIEFPNETWKDFIRSAYRYKSTDKFLEFPSVPFMERACNQLIQKFKECEKEKLPILIVNKSSGVSKKIAYYDTKESEFIVKGDISKKGNIELYDFLDRYLVGSLGLNWYENELKQIYREAPIHIKNKMQFSSWNNNEMSFKHFLCLGRQCDHLNCYKNILHLDEVTGTKMYKFINRELKNIDGNKFILNEEEYEDFVSDYSEHLINHEHYEIYKKYRHEDKDTIYTSEVQEKQSQILEQLYSTICSICNFKSMVE